MTTDSKHRQAAELIAQHDRANEILGGDYSADEKQRAAGLLVFTSIELGKLGYRQDASERWMYPISDDRQ